VDNLVFCCYAAHNPTDKLENTEKILGLAGQGGRINLETFQKFEGRKQKR